MHIEKLFKMRIHCWTGNTRTSVALLRVLYDRQFTSGLHGNTTVCWRWSKTRTCRLPLRTLYILMFGKTINKVPYSRTSVKRRGSFIWRFNKFIEAYVFLSWKSYSSGSYPL